MLRRLLVLLSALAIVLTLVSPVCAFCGFYVAGADTKLFNDATMVVLMRDGTRTVLSMQNRYLGPPEDFAMVVPVPVVLKEQDVKTLPAAVFDRIDRLGAPRLVEYWEYDPCTGPLPGGIGFGTTGLGFGSGIGRLGSASKGVKVEAEFSVGEYDIVILSASDAAALDGWLRSSGYVIPAGAEPYFRPYVAAGSKFFVAKVDPKKVKFEQGVAQLSPLRFHYDTEQFSLPVRLGLINSQGKQDLIVNILARQRYSVANYPNTTIVTNLDVTEQAREQFGEFYAALFDEALGPKQDAVVTEYAWAAKSCDPCPEAPLNDQELLTLGADVIDSMDADKAELRRGPARIRMLPAKISGPGKLPPEVIQRIVRRSLGRVRACYESSRADKSPTGAIDLHFTINSNGKVANPRASGEPFDDKAVVQCVGKVTTDLTFPRPEGGSVGVILRLNLSPGGPSRSRSDFARDLVLTRLHARYDKDVLGADLVFEAAKPIVGGRERRGADGKLEHGASDAAFNNFQARYAIRHAWTGAITCDNPVRGRWGGRPANSAGNPPAGNPPAGNPPVSATRLGTVKRGTVKLSTFIGPSSVSSPRTGPSAAPGQQPAPAASAAPSPSAAPASTDPATGSGCGCSLPRSRTAPLSGWLALLALAALGAQRNRRRRIRA